MTSSEKNIGRLSVRPIHFDWYVLDDGTFVECDPIQLFAFESALNGKIVRSVLFHTAEEANLACRLAQRELEATGSLRYIGPEPVPDDG